MKNYFDFKIDFRINQRSVGTMLTVLKSIKVKRTTKQVLEVNTEFKVIESTNRLMAGNTSKKWKNTNHKKVKKKQEGKALKN